MIAAGALAAGAMFTTPSHAQNAAPGQVSPSPVQVTPMPYPTTPGRYPVGAEKTELVTPNTALLGAGGLAFLGAYVPGFIVAASSDHDGDKWLYAPLIGPWIDLASRGCDDDQIVQQNCGTDGFDRAALIGSGVVQALGVAAMFGSFVLPQKRITVGSAEIKLAPASFGARSHGLMAFGNF